LGCNLQKLSKESPMVQATVNTWNTQAPESTALSARYHLHWSVIPLDADKKPVKTGGTHPDGNPKRLGWKAYQERLSTEQEIRAWQKKYNPPAWAVITGKKSKVVVLDFDGEQGEETRRRLGLDPHVRTGSGGSHVYFKHPGWLVPTLNSKSKKELGQRWPGLDIRADGGYAAFCGKNASGPYQWLREPVPDDLVILPDELRIFLGLMNPPDSRPSSSDLQDILIDKALARVGSMGGRDDAGFWLACQLRDNRFSQSQAESALLDYARRVPNTNAKGQPEPFTNDDAKAKVKSAYDAPARQAWEMPYYHAGPAAAGNSNGNGHHKQPVDEHSGSFHHTDFGNAERLVARHGRNLLYCHAMSNWLVWNGQQWSEDKTGAAERLAKETVRSIYAEASLVTRPDPEGEAERKAIAAHAMKSESKSHIRDMLILAQSEPGVPIKREQLDTDPWLLNVANGTIDLRTGQLREHIPADLITKCLTTPYIPDAPCPRWQAFLHMTFNGNADLIAFMQRALGYALTGDTSEQCFFLLHGSGNNGKSTLLETIQGILSDYAQSAEFKAFLARDNEGIRNDIARMNGKRLVVAKESDKGRRFAEALIKQLTGGDTITARFLHQEFFDFKPQFKLFLAANHKPEIKGTDFAIWRRVRLIPFTVVVSESQKDRDLPRKLQEEAPGILAWLLQGCLAWQREGLEMPQEVRSATESYRDEMDVIARFLAESCDPGGKVGSSEMLQAYKSWCEDNGERNDPKQLRTALQERGYAHKRGHGGRYVWYGIELKGEPSPPSGEPSSSQSEHKNASGEHGEPKNGNLPFEGENDTEIPKNGSPRFTSSPGSQSEDQGVPFHIGQRVTTPEGPGTIARVDADVERVKVTFSPGRSGNFPMSQVMGVQS
jgi:P4 family phage/plasmid primase-like protien